MAVEGLSITSADGVVDAVINRGDANLLTMEICRALIQRLKAPEPEDHVLRIRADGPAFCLGRERSAETAADLRAETRTLIELNQSLSSSRLVTVAQVQGDAAGFGVGLASLCDITVAAPSAGFRFPEVDIDLAPAVVLSWLPRIVGRKEAFRLAASGRRIGAGRACELGLVNVVADSDEALGPATDDEVTGLRKHSPRVHAEIKDFLRSQDDLTEGQAYELAIDRLVLGSMARRR